ncbi:hypothetical protein Moror_4291 [Moniliophthora roreri MCA 2997]|uniref:Uncharacterized protein n=1 Tax=Moniliophthora roreri (strain MCA 2997) TaxID=1381753 RepID=V2XDG5_MONRO|nr:hypothetical protein Moror_4291 [Moniliophthora roreri MCA 2997]
MAVKPTSHENSPNNPQLSLPQEVLSNVAECLVSNDQALVTGLLLCAIASVAFIAWRILRFQFPCIIISELGSEEERLNDAWNAGLVGRSFRGEEEDCVRERLLSIRKRASEIRGLSLEFELRCSHGHTFLWMRQYLLFHAGLAIRITKWHREADCLRLRIRSIIERDAQSRCDNELSYQTSLRFPQRQSSPRTAYLELSAADDAHTQVVSSPHLTPGDLRRRSAPCESCCDDLGVGGTPSGSSHHHQKAASASAGTGLGIFSWATRFRHSRRCLSESPSQV